MQENTIIERFGGIFKHEVLVSLQDSMYENLILEALHPFPGYYDEYAADEKPLYFYLVAKETVEPEKLFRTAHSITKSFKHNFEVTNGVITLFNDVYPVIRVRNLEKFDLIRDLSKMFENEGIALQKRLPRELNSEGIIKLFKFFKLEDLGDNILLDHNEKDFLYFTIPHELSWEKFEKVTRNVKYNWNKSPFDAALGFFFKDKKVVEMVRIYHQNVDKEFVNDLKELYYKEVDRW